MGRVAAGELHHHCLISGTGRAGTTFLVILLTRLGVDTGFTPQSATARGPGRAGLEITTLLPTSPYVLKAPAYCDRIDALLADDPNLVIDCVIAPVRDFRAAAESRAFTQAETTGSRRGSGTNVRGGLWLTEDPERQEDILRRQFSTLIASLARHDIPLVLLWYPRLTRDPEYVYGKLNFLFRDKAYEEFGQVFSALVRPDWVHRFGSADL